MNSAIFISYRRLDASWATRALYDGLSDAFENDNVFMDVEDIEIGNDFVAKIEREVGRCDVMLAVIGVNWISAIDERGERRLFNLQDYVRLELSMGLKRRIPVIPVLVDGATMPKADELPEDLVALRRQNAISLNHTTFDLSIKHIVNVLQDILGYVNSRKSLFSLEEPPFDKLIHEDKKALGIYFSFTTLVVVLGIALVAIGFMPMSNMHEGLEGMGLKLGGGFISTLGSLPLKEYLARRDRIKGVENLRDLWQKVYRSEDPQLEKLQKIEEIIWKIYEKGATG